MKNQLLVMSWAVTVALLAAAGVQGQVQGQNVPAPRYAAPAANASAARAHTAVLSRVEQLEAELASLRRFYDGAASSEIAFRDGPPCGSCGLSDCCCSRCTPTWDFWTDLGLLQFHKTGGVQTGSDAFTGVNPEAVNFGFDLAPRFHLRGYLANDCYSEFTYFLFDHSAPNGGGDSVDVRSYTLDWHLGQRAQVTTDWSLEYSAAVRYMEFHEVRNDDGGEFNVDHSRGFGGLMSLGTNYRLFGAWSLYGGARAGAVFGDHRIAENRGLATNVVLTDETFLQMEFYSGVQYTRTLGNGAELFVRGGVDWIHLSNVTSQFSFSAPGLAGHELSVLPGADAGFAGYSTAAGLRW